MSQRREAQEEEYKIDPRVQVMSKEEVKLFAGLVRSCGEEESEELAAQSDEQVASSLLWLQDQGLVSIEFDGEDVGIRLLDLPSAGRQRGERLAPAGEGVRSSRRERRRKKRRKR